MIAAGLSPPSAPSARAGFARALTAVLSFGVAAGAAGSACTRSQATLPTPSEAPGPFAALAATGDPARGDALARKYECQRCHSDAIAGEIPRDQQCVGCHRSIVEGSSGMGAALEAKWEPKVRELADAPTLGIAAHRFRREWLVSFLLRPHDLRPGLVPTMPRLALAPREAADLAAYLAPSPAAPPAKVPVAIAAAGGNVATGRAIFEAKGCAVCHRFTGAGDLHASALPTDVVTSGAITGDRLARAVRLAPDLAETRERMAPPEISRWLKQPSAVAPKTLMPDFALTAEETRHLAAFIARAPLAPNRAAAVPARLPLLARTVTYDEVEARIFHKACWHCHGEPDLERGNGGPGNSGGFGFAGKRLNLTDYAGVFAGEVGEDGQRRSVFLPIAGGDAGGTTDESDKTPRLVEVLLARQREEAGAAPGPVRGMPLGLPSLPPEDIQLLETWIAGGRKR